jgi:hypothetical protein
MNIVYSMYIHAMYLHVNVYIMYLHVYTMYIMYIHVYTMYHVHTLHVHVHTVYIHVHECHHTTMYYIHIPLWYVYKSSLVCTALVIGMYCAIVQELVIMYIEVSDWDRPPRNG